MTLIPDSVGRRLTGRVPHERIRAVDVPRGTVFFMNNGRLMMASAGMFDKAGNFLALGGY